MFEKISEKLNRKPVAVVTSERFGNWVDETPENERDFHVCLVVHFFTSHFLLLLFLNSLVYNFTLIIFVLGVKYSEKCKPCECITY